MAMALKKMENNMSESETITNFESYPPIFRQPKNPVELDNDSTIKPIQNSDQPPPPPPPPIPLIDFKCINLDLIDEACKDWGIFRLVNHGVPATLLNQLHDHAQMLFSLPFESKQALFDAPITYFWGTPALTTSGVALTRQKINWVEGFNVPLNQLSHDLQNEGPSMVVPFRLLLEEYGKHLASLASTLYEAMAKNLKLDSEKDSKSYLSESTGIIRVYRYLQCSDNTNQAWGMHVHTDSSVLSILNQDQVGGLEVLKDEKWINIEPIPNTLVVNLGDIIQAMSDDEYKSVKHRVKLNKSEERISIGYFVFSADDAIIQSSSYKPFTYVDFRAQVQEDVKTIGFKVGLERFKLN